MKVLLRNAVLPAILGLQAAAVQADTPTFSVGIISHSSAGGTAEASLQETLSASDAQNLAFVVVNGIKKASEPCTDPLYRHRKDMLNAAQNGIVVSLAAGDWAECKNGDGKSGAVAKLGLVREILFEDEFSLGASRIPVIRQSTNPKFRGFVENARWEMGEVMFATLNLPANNNHFVFDAGRNSEFEDRTIANRDWLQRVFTHAIHKKLEAIVLFCDANPLAIPRQQKRDGFKEVRRQLVDLAQEFKGKVLVAYNDPGRRPPAIRWRNKLGELNAGTGVTLLTVGPNGASFSIESMQPSR